MPDPPLAGVAYEKVMSIGLFGLYPVPLKSMVKQNGLQSPACTSTVSPGLTAGGDGGGAVGAGGAGGAGGTNWPVNTAVTSTTAPVTLSVHGLPCPAQAPSQAVKVWPGVT